MVLPPLTNLESTAQELRKAAQVIAAIRLLELEHSPHYLEFSLNVKAEGLSTAILPSRGEVTLDFKQSSIRVIAPNGKITSVSLAGNSQVSLFEAVLGAMSIDGVSSAPDGSRLNALLTAIKAKGRPVVPDRANYADPTPFKIDPQLASDYADAVYHVFTAIARFRARLEGYMTPLVVWSEHFDISFLWFATEEAAESAPHMNFGFAPFSPGFERPYLYAYAYPLPGSYDPPELPAPARWNTERWTGVVLDYDDMRKPADPEGFIEDSCLGIYRSLAKLLNR
jgi:hypothetical protein